MCMHVYLTCSYTILPYSRKFLWDKIFTKPSYLCIVVISRDKIFTNVLKVAISTMQSLTQEKELTDKIFTNESRW